MKAIDVHVHVTSLFGYERIFGKEVADHLKKYYGVGAPRTRKRW